MSPAMIGLSAAMTPLGFIVSSPFIPWMSRRFGAGPLTIWCSAFAALLLALVGWTQDVWLWFPLRFLLGFFANPLYVVSETWLIAIAPAAKRGRLMGIYTSIVSAGFALGPVTLAIVGTEGWPPFLVGIGAFCLCGLILVLVLPRLPDMRDDKHHTSVGGFVLLWVDRMSLNARYHDAQQFTLPMYFGIGLVQVLSMVPGVSRAGATILGAMLFGADRRSAAEFSFWLAMPTMVGAFALELYKSRAEMAGGNWLIVAVGFVASFICGWIVVKTFLDYVSHHSFAVFAWWRIIVGALGLAALAIGL